MSAQPAPDETAAGRRISRWLLHPRARTAVLGLLLIGFAVGVSVYMQVVNRYVHFSVHVDAPSAVEAGGAAPMRVHVHRPDSRLRLRGTATWRGADDRIVAEAALVTGVATPFTLVVPEDAEDRVAFQLEVRVDQEPLARHAEITIPVVGRPAPRTPGSSLLRGLPEEGSPRRVQPQSGAERARVQRLRMDPAGADLDAIIVPETGFPVRFLENRFLVRLTRRDGTPLGAQPGVIRLVSDGEPVERAFVTDVLGLAEVRATPQDIANWWVETTLPTGAEVTAQFEVVPGFDSIIARPSRPIVASDAPIRLSILSALRAERWYYDLIGEERWLATGLGRTLEGRHRIDPPNGRWLPDRHPGARYVQLQVYTSPFARTPQSSVRGLIVRDPATSEEDVVDWLVDALAARDLDGDYLRALRAAELLDANTPQASRDRLVELLIVRLLPTLVLPPAAYDDAASQTSALLAETTRFRARMHWLLGLGVLGLLCWIAGRIAIYTVQTRRRTRLFLAELDDDEVVLVDDTALADLRSAIVPMTLAAITIAAFFFGVLFMLAAM